MNNSEFRKFIALKGKAEDGSPPASRPGATPALGAKKSSFVGMTPRPGKAVDGNDFARQVREQHAALKPTKKFRSSAPKGSKFTAGYTDRAKARQQTEDDADDRAKRIQALEEQVKLGQLEQETFEKLRDQIIGDDASASYLVKGLDRRLLERARRGEDVLGLKGAEKGEAAPDVDQELEKLGEQEVETIVKEKAEKKGTKAPAQVAGVKRSRDEIMAELKAQRKAAQEAKAATAPTLDNRWRKIGEEPRPKIEIDHKGREVLITVDENGVVKKKVRKVAEPEKIVANMPDTSKPVLGADVVIPEAKKPDTDDDGDDIDDDIFEGAGTEYNPLGDMDDDNEDSSDEDEVRPATNKTSTTKSMDTGYESGEASVEDRLVKEANPVPATAANVSRNYFGGKASAEEEAEQNRFKGVENVIAKAAKLGTAAPEEDRREDETDADRKARLAKRAKMLANQDRDLEDMDMGFGGSRGEDEEDLGEDKKVKLSEWKGKATFDDEDDAEGGSKGDGKKKRKPKKRKGDANNMSDIMRVIEGRKVGGK
ncbi:hypothetical protein DOTSEDRAFT_72961 [Dothistroma septosporum NZE10]|uniref:RED-like N-terminal domain-containing protein n=1 Tax=Dothistroma septosporum (strain NZE10 / CBS 128990) TaxID=675120 RepID=N1PL47_DOTSN|nr:hypothetical protein DOTSEDRAFT_72961 [Dothistroma septosporum NZE10]